MDSFAISPRQHHPTVPVSNQPKADSPAASTDEDAKKKKQHRSRSWLAPHRRKDSTGSPSLLRGKSLLRSASVASAVPPRPTPPLLPSPSSRSRRSYESDDASSSSKTTSYTSSKATTVETSPVLSSEKSTLPPYRPQRPLRPDEGLFECSIVKDNEDGGQHVPGDAQTIGRPFSPFAESTTTRGSRRFSDLERLHQANRRVTTPEVHRLMLEADLAYEAVDTALANTMPRSSRASSLSEGSAPSPSVPIYRLSRRTVSDVSDASLPLEQSNGSTSNSQKRKGSDHMSTDLETRQQARTSRWTLTENMAEMFKSQRIMKTDKKRMTPSRIEAILNGEDNTKTTAKSEKIKKRRKAASDSLLPAMEPSEDPADVRRQTFRLEPFRQSVYAASPVPMNTATIRKRSIPFEIAIPPPSSILVSPEIIHEDISIQRSPTISEKWEIATTDEDAIAEDEDGNSDSENAAFLIPPPKNPLRFTMRAPTMPLLPSIPESFRASPRSDKFPERPPRSHLRSRSLNHSISSVRKDECFYFNSTPFTLNSPSFRHGPIAFQKHDIGRDSVTSDPEDADMDWSAFQMAMLGGIDEDLHEFFPDEEREENGDIAEEVAAWFEEFGFETHGELIPSEEPEQKEDKKSTQRDSSGSMTSASSSPSTVRTDSDAELPTPVSSSQRQPHVFDTIRMLRTRCESTYSASIYTIDSADAPWVPEAIGAKEEHNGLDVTVVTAADEEQSPGSGIEAFHGCRLDRLY